MDVVRDIEDAFAAHWSLFGRWTHGDLRDEHGVRWFETPIKHLPYNGVIQTRIDGDADQIIDAVLDRFRARGVDFFWLAHPSARPADLRGRLAARGLEAVETAIGMSLELADWGGGDRPEGVEYREVADEDDLNAYQELTAAYWEIPADDRPLVAQLQREWGPGRAPGHRYLALIDGRPVGKGYLSLAGPRGIAGIYGMSTLPEARGRGVAAGLTTVLLDRARERGCTRVVLHSSEMAVGIYRRAGFVERCRFTVLATAPVWSHEA